MSAAFEPLLIVAAEAIAKLDAVYAAAVILDAERAELEREMRDLSKHLKEFNDAHKNSQTLASP